MSTPDTIELYVAFGHPKPSDPFHWLLMARPHGSNRCTYYHSAGGPIYSKPYELSIQPNKFIESTGLSAKYLIATISSQDIAKLKLSAESVSPQYCQAWVVEVLRKLEQKGVVEAGTATAWQIKMEFNPHAGIVLKAPSPILAKMLGLKRVLRKMYSRFHLKS